MGNDEGFNKMFTEYYDNMLEQNIKEEEKNRQRYVNMLKNNDEANKEVYQETQKQQQQMVSPQKVFTVFKTISFNGIPIYRVMSNTAMLHEQLPVFPDQRDTSATFEECFQYVQSASIASTAKDLLENT